MAGPVTNSQITVNYTLSSGNRLGNWSVAETALVGQVDVIGRSSDPIGTDPRFGGALDALHRSLEMA